MACHRCPHCVYETDRKSNLTRHINLIHPVRERYTCPSCGVTYARKCTLKAHTLHCSANQDNMLICAGCDRVFESRQALHYHRRKCSEYLSGVDSEEQIRPINQQVNIHGGQYNHCTINNTNNNTIHINNFNNENREYITYEFAKQCFDAGVFGIPPMMDNLYFNKEHPENHNARLKSLKKNLAEIKTDDGWTPQGLLGVVDRIITNSTNEILRHVTAHPLDPEQDLFRLNAIQNIEAANRKKLRDRTKCKLLERRDYGTGI